jgi:hypothetical protein
MRLLFFLASTLICTLILLGCPGNLIPQHGRGAKDGGGGRPRLDQEGGLPSRFDGPHAIDVSLAQEGKMGSKDQGVVADLPIHPGDPCPTGECAKSLICMAGLCRATCSGVCGEVAPECQPNEGCHWASSFSSACFPGTSQLMEACENGVSCLPDLLCVKTARGSLCLALCKNAPCPLGTTCIDADNGCKVCLPN